jgi:phosphate transport system substrate-binding protein
LNKRGTFIAGLALVAALAVAGTAAAVTRGSQSPAASRAAAAGSLTGAGSTFVFPLVSQWIPAVDSAYGVKITYGSVGSGAGIQQIINKTVDFGTTDAPLTGDQFSACGDCVQIPWALSGTAIPYNVAGAPNHLHLSGSVLAGIFMGTITKWNAPAIAALNKGAQLPATNITVVHRSDGSGTTFNFTDYLSNANAAWRSKVGKGTAVNWPTGIGGRGSSGVAGVLTHTDGAIGYVDVAYALANHLKFAAVQNRAGKYTLPGLRAIKAAAATVVRVAPNNSGISIVNPGKKQSLAYPISTFTYVVVHKSSPKAQDLRTFIHWALTKGQTFGPKLLFQPIPPVILKASLKALAQVK